MNKEIPFFAIGNNELKDLPKVGNTAICPNCKKKHKVKYPKDTKTGKISKILGIVNCKKSGESYLISVDSKLLKTP